MSNSRAGDWKCRTCEHLNFQRRDSCQRCGDHKSAGNRSSGGGGSSGVWVTGSDVRPGDWYCAAANCATHNFANRSTCFECGAFKDLPRSRPAWKSGDWFCTMYGCNEHNFANRMECFRCNWPRDLSLNYASF